jgi:hypothetical protein
MFLSVGREQIEDTSFTYVFGRSAICSLHLPSKNKVAFSSYIDERAGGEGVCNWLNAFLGIVVVELARGGEKVSERRS